jgi:hypothetical protein
MIALLNILIFLAFATFLIFANTRMTLQVKNTPKIEGSILFITFLLSINAFFISRGMQTYSWFYKVPWQTILQASVGCMAFCLLCFVIIASVKGITSKQLRTLLRLPLIGILLGIFFEYKFILLGFGVIQTLLLVHLFRKKEDQLYIFRQYSKGYVGAMVFILGTYYKIEILPMAGALLFLVMAIQIINAIKLKMNLDCCKEKNEANDC